MSPIATSIIVFAFVFGGALAGAFLRPFLPDHHLSSDSKDVIRLGMGLVATTVALVLGLLIASAKGFYDTQNTEVIQAAANLVLLDRILVHYGPEANQSRASLRRLVTSLVNGVWHRDEANNIRFDPAAGNGDPLLDEIQELSPGNENQRSLKSEALAIAMQLAQTRWLMFEQKASSLPMPLLVMLTSWLTVLFISFGLFVRPNPTLVASLFASAFVVCGAVLLILEMYQPYGGLIRVSDAPMQAALTQLGK